MSGDVPDKICPVIIPGRETRPIAKSEFVIGIKDALNAMPRAFSKCMPRSNSASNRSAARLIPFIELANIIPANGIIYLGMYHGSNSNRNCVTSNKFIPPPIIMEINAYQNKLFLFYFIAPNAIQLAIKTINIKIRRIINELFELKI